MEISSATQEKQGLRNLPRKFKDKVVEVAERIKKIGQDDPRRIIHSLKVGLALTLTSLFYYFKPLYDGFGIAGIWAVLTVVVVFEFTVGATLSKSINRGFATFVAGALGIGAEYFADLFGTKGKPIVLGVLVFLLAAASTFTRFFPKIKRKYDYGVLIFILTFSLVAVSGYRFDKLIELGHQRLSTILIGGATCMMISIFICPVWAGQDLHNLITSNIETLASFLEGFRDEFFKISKDGDSHADAVYKDDKLFPKGYKSILNSKANEESLENFAWWEPGHGSFKFRHPWKQYLKIASLTRQCAYHFEALSIYINSETKETSSELKRKIQEPCMKMSTESGKAMKELTCAMKTMTCPSAADPFVNNCKTTVDELKRLLETSTIKEEQDILEIVPIVTTASILIDIINCIEKLSEAVHGLSSQAGFKSSVETKPTAEQTQTQLLHRGTVNPVVEASYDNHILITLHETLDSPKIENTDVKSKRVQKS